MAWSKKKKKNFLQPFKARKFSRDGHTLLTKYTVLFYIGIVGAGAYVCVSALVCVGVCVSVRELENVKGKQLFIEKLFL